MERLPLSLSGRRPTTTSLSLSPALPPFGPARRPSALPAPFPLGPTAAASQSEAAQSPAQRGRRCFPSPLPLSPTVQARLSASPLTSSRTRRELFLHRRAESPCLSRPSGLSPTFRRRSGLQPQRVSRRPASLACRAPHTKRPIKRSPGAARRPISFSHLPIAALL